MKKFLKKLKDKYSYEELRGFIDGLTHSRIIGSVALPFIFALSGGIAAGIWLLILFATDALDGFLARGLEITTPEGAKLDQTADKVLGLTSLLSLLMVAPIMQIPIALEVSIVAANIIKDKLNLETSSSQLGRVKTVILALGIGASFIAAGIVPTSQINEVIKLIMIAPMTLQAMTAINYISPVLFPKAVEKTRVLKDKFIEDCKEEDSSIEYNKGLKKEKRQKDFLRSELNNIHYPEYGNEDIQRLTLKKRK